MRDEVAADRDAVNYAQVFHTPYPADGPLRSIDEAMRAVRFCSWCGRERGPRVTCDGCGAPSVLTTAPYTPPPPFSFEWWAERSPVFGVKRSEHAGDALSYLYGPIRLYDADVPEGEACVFSGQVGFDPNAPMFPLHDWDPRRGVRITGAV